MKAMVLVLTLICALTLSGCHSAAPLTQPVPPDLQQPVVIPSVAPETDATALPEPVTLAPMISDGFKELMAYVPSEWADEHPYAAMSPGILLLDLARMSADLGLPPMTGADDRKIKLDLITGMTDQNLLRCPGVWTDNDAFENWGWDIADIDQVLCDLGTTTAVFFGDFGRPEIEERLIGMGYRTQKEDQFTIFAGDGDMLNFAVKPDTLIVSSDRSELERLIGQKEHQRHSVYEHPAVTELLSSLTQDAWGIWIAPSGNAGAFEAYIEDVLDRTSYNEQMVQELIKFYQPGQAVELGWDTMAVGFVGGKDDVTTLTFLYHYPSADEAKRDAPLLERTLKEMPSLSSTHGMVLGDLITLQTVETTGSVLKAVGTTRSQSFLGKQYANGDCLFLPFRVIAPAPFPDWQEFTAGDGKFSILMPGAPSEYAELVNSTAGETNSHAVVFDGQGYHYEVTYIDYPLKLFQVINFDAAVENWRHALVGTVGYKVLGDYAVLMNEHEGREMRVEVNGGEASVCWRIFAVRNRLYILQVSAPEEEAFSQDADKFFASFVILESD